MKKNKKNSLFVLFIFISSIAYGQIYIPRVQKRTYVQLDVNRIQESWRIAQNMKDEAFYKFNNLLVLAEEAVSNCNYDFAITYLEQCQKINDNYEFCSQKDILDKINECKKKKKEKDAEEKRGNKTAPNHSYPVKKWAGTGFAINKGLVVTNYHVIANATLIKIYGIKGDFSKAYNAVPLVVDVNSDLAILKVSNFFPDGFGRIPYRIYTDSKNVGDDIFVLGYPLTDSMGDEIKLTNGIISARTGYKGDISQYQISAPVQPGSSGGPLFDRNGNLIGIVNSKHSEAENVGYAIKTSLLKTLAESSDLEGVFPSSTTLQSQSLANQVKMIKNYVFLIKCQ